MLQHQCSKIVYCIAGFLPSQLGVPDTRLMGLVNVFQALAHPAIRSHHSVQPLQRFPVHNNLHDICPLVGSAGFCRILVIEGWVKLFDVDDIFPGIINIVIQTLQKLLQQLFKACSLLMDEDFVLLYELLDDKNPLGRWYVAVQRDEPLCDLIHDHHAFVLHVVHCIFVSFLCNQLLKLVNEGCDQTEEKVKVQESWIW